MDFCWIYDHLVAFIDEKRRRRRHDVVTWIEKGPHWLSDIRRMPTQIPRIMFCVRWQYLNINGDDWQWIGADTEVPK